MTEIRDLAAAGEDSQERAPADEAPGWMLRPGHLVAVGAAGIFFLLLSYLPLQSADLWSHVFYGEWILEHRSLPAEDPIMPLAEGMPVIDGSWLAQAILATVERAGGAEWMSNLFALTVLASSLLLGRVFFLASGSLALSMLGVLASVLLGWGRLTTFRPESFGVLAFAILLWLIASSRSEPAAAGRGAGSLRRLWLGIPLLFVVWANLDGSFVYGLALPLCLFLGRAIDVAYDRGLRAATDDPQARRWLVLTELAVAATLINPYGIDLLLHQLAMPASPNLLYMPEWQPLVMMGPQALGFALSFALLLAVFRHSRRRVPAADVLLLAVFAFAAATGVGRMIWFGPVLVWIVVPHVAELTARRRRPVSPWAARAAGGLRRLAEPSVRYTMLCATVVAMVFLLSPIGSQALGREARSVRQLFGASPLDLAGYLAANPPAGLVFNPANWGGWLALQGPDGLRLFATTDVEWLPPRVWESYRQIANTASGWSRYLAGYRVETVIVSKLDQQSLARALRNSEDWVSAYEDDHSMVFVPAADRSAGAPAAGELAGEPTEDE